MATTAVCRLLLRARPRSLAPTTSSASWVARRFVAAAPPVDAVELNPAKGVGESLFQSAVQTSISTPKSWDSLFPDLVTALCILGKSPVSLFLQLDKKGVLKGFGKCYALQHFLKQNDTAMIDYCLKSIGPSEYNKTCFVDAISYLEKHGRQDESDRIIQNSFSTLLDLGRAVVAKCPRMSEIVLRAVHRTHPAYQFQQHIRMASTSEPLCAEFIDPVLDKPVDKSGFRAKNFMTRAEFRKAFEKELGQECNPVDSCAFMKVDALNLTARSANAAHMGKVEKFMNQLLKQWETGIKDYITKRQMALRDILFSPDVLEASDYKAGDYQHDLTLMLMDPAKTARVITYFFYRKILLFSPRVTETAATGLLFEINKSNVAFINLLDEEAAERLYKLFEQVHFDMTDELSCLPARIYINYLVSQGAERIMPKRHINSHYAITALASIILNTLHIGRFRRLNGEWSPVFTYDQTDRILYIDPALDAVRSALKTANIVKDIEPTKMPMEFPPMFNSALTKGSGKHLLNMSNMLLSLTPMTLNPILNDALDAVGQVAFKVDPRVVHCMTARLNELRLDRLDSILCIPQALQTQKMVEDTRKDASGLADSMLAQQIHEEYIGMREDIGNRLLIANYFKDERPFWGIPVLDFRGRHYNRSHFLATTSPDVIRGCLRFATGVPLGASGWEWLKVHLANLHGGCKKRSRQQKVDFVDSRMDDIIRSADNPNEGHQWWKECDSPVQALITSYELVDALRSGCPQTYISNLPVHQDGSCNGMQHYSALGRDVEGAKLVSLSAEPSSLDLYTSVAKRVEKKLRDQVDNDMVPLATQDLARKCIPYAIRKVVKQTVMTTVYGVTKAGAELQVERAIKRTYGHAVPDLARISSHMVVAIFEVLDEVFAVARKIQRWLVMCVNRVASQGYYMTWKTPLGMIVEQPYSKVPLGHVAKNLLLEPKFVIEAGGEIEHQVVDVSATKHTIAFAPNFIHSLDATHMMMTALQMKKEGFVYAAVHDSYWTHAAHVDDMNRIIREQFVSLYTKPIIEDLADQLQHNFGDPKVSWKEDVFMNFPKPGHFDIQEVLKSERFFS